MQGCPARYAAKTTNHKNPNRVPSSTSVVRCPVNTAPVSMLMRLGRTSGSAAGVWPWTTTTPWSAPLEQERRRGSR